MPKATKTKLIKQLVRRRELIENARSQRLTDCIAINSLTARETNVGLLVVLFAKNLTKPVNVVGYECSDIELPRNCRH